VSYLGGLDDVVFEMESRYSSQLGRGRYPLTCYRLRVCVLFCVPTFRSQVHIKDYVVAIYSG